MVHELKLDANDVMRRIEKRVEDLRVEMRPSTIGQDFETLLSGKRFLVGPFRR